MDDEILKQNMGLDGKQPIHVNEKEASLVEMLERYKEREGVRDFSAPDGVYDNNYRFTYDPNNPPVFELDKSNPRVGEMWSWEDVRTLLATDERKNAPEVFAAKPTAMSGLKYVNSSLRPEKDMRGNKTPEHLQRVQDDIVSYKTSEQARNLIEGLRMEMPRNIQDNMNGSIFIEQGRDGTHSLVTGNDMTGYTELLFGGEDGMRKALDTVKRGFAHMYDVGDVDMDAGFWGRVNSANDFKGYSERDVNDAMMSAYAQAQQLVRIDPRLAAEALLQADMAGDELRRQRNKPESHRLAYSRRVLDRELGRRAKLMMQ